METLSADQIFKHLAAALREGIEGPVEGSFAYFSDHGPDAGLRRLLGGISSGDATRVIGENSIAAHVHHLIYAFRISAEWLRGNRTRADWPQSWVVPAIDDAQWEQLRTELSAAFADLEAVMAENATASEMGVGITIGSVAHIAYHLGAIRQKFRMLGLSSG